MTSDPATGREPAPRPFDAAIGSFGRPNAIVRQFDFWDDRYEGRRLFSELLGTFFLVLAAAGGGMVNARFGGHAIPAAALVVAPALMVIAIILFMGAVSGAHLNPAVSVAFALRGDFPWKRVPTYIVAQFAGAVLATLLLWALIGRHGSAGLTLPGPGISVPVALLWEMVLTTGLVSVILGTASGAQQIGPLAAIGVGSYIALAGLWGVAGQRRLDEPRPLTRARPGARRLDRMVGLPRRPARARSRRGRDSYILRGPGGGNHGTRAAQGTLGTPWRPRRAGQPLPAPGEPHRPAEEHGESTGQGPA